MQIDQACGRAQPARVPLLLFPLTWPHIRSYNITSCHALDANSRNVTCLLLSAFAHPLFGSHLCTVWRPVMDSGIDSNLPADT